MKRATFVGILMGALALGACNFQNSSTPMVPTAPSNTGGTGTTGTGGTGSTGGNNPGGNTGSNTAISQFAGVWASNSIAGLPLGKCSDVKWVITAQTDTMLSGTITATCDSGVTVSATLSGTLRNANVMDITANGSFTAMGVPCGFNLTGTGTRQSDDSMKIDYSGTYCFGNVSGTETLRKFPL
jgi:hypothetical protein